MQLQNRSQLVLVGQADNWQHCAQLLDHSLPEILIISASLLPAAPFTADSPWPLHLVIGPSKAHLSIPHYDPSSFRAALDATIARVLSTKALELSNLMQSYISALRAEPLNAFKVTCNGREYTIPSREVKFITVDGNYARLHTAAGQFRLRETLNSLASSLDATQFARIHRSIIVNLTFVDRVLTTADRASALVLRDRTHLPIGPTFSLPAPLLD